MKWLFAIAMILVLAACQGRPDAPSTDVSLMKIPSPEQEKPPHKSGKNQRKFIRNGHIEFETDDAEATRKVILAAVKANNAFVSQDKENRSEDQVTYTMWVHVPADRFDLFLSSATKGVSVFRHKNISIEDVTARYADTESRLRTKREIENRYRTLLSRASTVSDILEIEKELGTIRTDIEATEAQFKTLNDKIDYSALQIVFIKPILTSNPFLRDVGDAFREGFANLRSFAVTLVSVWPFVLLAIGVVAALRWWRKRRKAAPKRETAELP